MSEYVRRRDRGQCITCGKTAEWKYMQAGHFAHINALNFCEENINCQCPTCNYTMKWDTSLAYTYGANINLKFGPKTVESLEARRHEIHKFSRTELEEIIKNLEEKIKKL